MAGEESCSAVAITEVKWLMKETILTTSSEVLAGGPAS
jgi:hypothetical protein